ncbi:hypothetical protein B7P43_G12511 [Cryptotermes secundus]|uniref:PiggyBac transposable element-derived protein domain-containing protein n=1 Tax=Cryptotermes secundus TaxID=105785 RepID=A0A2J7PU47_9NEOP|nr:hypothetical protein B7P43_G12511 [Cryptotermes secundus]
MYFSSKHMLETQFFPNVMSEERFSLLTRFLHFVDNTNKETAKRDPKLYKILPVSEYLKKKFQKVYIPGKEIGVDESLLLWKGRLSWKQYIPMKASRFGIKIFELCDSAGYLWNFIIYSGSGTKLGCEITKEIDLFSSKVVLSLCVYMDNVYSSPDLFQRLVQRTTDAVGTVKITRKSMPFHIQREQSPAPPDQRTRVGFHKCKMLCKHTVFVYMLFTYEAGFTKEGVINFHNTHFRVDDNSHTTVASGHERRLCQSKICFFLLVFASTDLNICYYFKFPIVFLWLFQFSSLFMY